MRESRGLHGVSPEIRQFKEAIELAAREAFEEQFGGGTPEIRDPGDVPGIAEYFLSVSQGSAQRKVIIPPREEWPEIIEDTRQIIIDEAERLRAEGVPLPTPPWEMPMIDIVSRGDLLDISEADLLSIYTIAKRQGTVKITTPDGSREMVVMGHPDALGIQSVSYWAPLNELVQTLSSMGLHAGVEALEEIVPRHRDGRPGILHHDTFHVEHMETHGDVKEMMAMTEKAFQKVDIAAWEKFIKEAQRLSA
jgi:hypothetical protein